MDLDALRSLGNEATIDDFRSFIDYCRENNKPIEDGLYLAISNNNLQAVALLLDSGADIDCNINIIPMSDEDYETPLMHAIVFRCNDIAKYLVKRGASLYKDRYNNNMHLLQMCIESKNYEMVEYLLDNGIDINSNDNVYIKREKDDDSESDSDKESDSESSESDSGSGYMHIIQYMIIRYQDEEYKYDDSIKDDHEQCLDLIKRLLSTRSIDIDYVDYRDRNILYTLLKNELDDTDIVKQLIEKRIDIHYSSSHTTAALIMTFNSGYYDIVDLLLKHTDDLSRYPVYDNIINRIVSLYKDGVMTVYDVKKYLHVLAIEKNANLYKKGTFHDAPIMSLMKDNEMVPEFETITSNMLALRKIPIDVTNDGIDHVITRLYAQYGDIETVSSSGKRIFAICVERYYEFETKIYNRNNPYYQCIKIILSRVVALTEYESENDFFNVDRHSSFIKTILDISNIPVMTVTERTSIFDIAYTDPRIIQKICPNKDINRFVIKDTGSFILNFVDPISDIDTILTYMTYDRNSIVSLIRYSFLIEQPRMRHAMDELVKDVVEKTIKDFDDNDIYYMIINLYSIIENTEDDTDISDYKDYITYIVDTYERIVSHKLSQNVISYISLYYSDDYQDDEDISFNGIGIDENLIYVHFNRMLKSNSDGTLLKSILTRLDINELRPLFDNTLLISKVSNAIYEYFSEYDTDAYKIYIVLDIYKILLDRRVLDLSTYNLYEGSNREYNIQNIKFHDEILQTIGYLFDDDINVDINESINNAIDRLIEIYRDQISLLKRDTIIEMISSLYYNTFMFPRLLSKLYDIEPALFTRQELSDIVKKYIDKNINDILKHYRDIDYLKRTRDDITALIHNIKSVDVYKDLVKNVFLYIKNIYDKHEVDNLYYCLLPILKSIDVDVIRAFITSNRIDIGYFENLAYIINFERFSDFEDIVKDIVEDKNNKYIFKFYDYLLSIGLPKEVSMHVSTDGKSQSDIPIYTLAMIYRLSGSINMPKYDTPDHIDDMPEYQESVKKEIIYLSKYITFLPDHVDSLKRHFKTHVIRYIDGSTKKIGFKKGRSDIAVADSRDTINEVDYICSFMSSYNIERLREIAISLGTPFDIVENASKRYLCALLSSIADRYRDIYYESVKEIIIDMIVYDESTKKIVKYRLSEKIPAATIIDTIFPELNLRDGLLSIKNSIKYIMDNLESDNQETLDAIERKKIEIEEFSMTHLRNPKSMTMDMYDTNHIVLYRLKDDEKYQWFDDSFIEYIWEEYNKDNNKEFRDHAQRLIPLKVIPDLASYHNSRFVDIGIEDVSKDNVSKYTPSMSLSIDRPIHLSVLKPLYIDTHQRLSPDKDDIIKIFKWLYSIRLYIPDIYDLMLFDSIRFRRLFQSHINKNLLRYNLVSKDMSKINTTIKYTRRLKKFIETDLKILYERRYQGEYPETSFKLIYSMTFDICRYIWHRDVKKDADDNVTEAIDTLQNEIDELLLQFD